MPLNCLSAVTKYPVLDKAAKGRFGSEAQKFQFILAGYSRMLTSWWLERRGRKREGGVEKSYTLSILLSPLLFHLGH